MRRVVFVPTLLVTLLALGGPALAGPEWCDDGSPPPNDFRLRPTGTGSATSSMAWLGSTTSGTLDLPAGINTLQGGVAIGMRTALQNARPYAELLLLRASAAMASRPDADDDSDD